MAVVLLVNGVDITAHVDRDSYDITDALAARGDTLTFIWKLSTSQISQRPLNGQPVTLTVDGDVIFGGDVSDVHETRIINADYFEYTITCSDYSRRLDRHLVVIQSIGPDLAGTIIKTILQMFAPEFAADLSGINDGVSATATSATPGQQFDYVPVSNVIDQLAQGSQFIWYIDPNKRVIFEDTSNFVAPIPVYDLDAELQLGDMTWEETIDQIKNRIYLKDANVASSSPRTDTYLADGSTSFFQAFSQPYDVGSTAVTTMDPSGVTKIWNVVLDPGTSTTETLNGSPGTAFLCIANWGIRFPLNDLPTAGSTVNATYSPTQGDVVYMVEDTDSQAMMRFREGGASDGVYEHMVSLPDIRVNDTTPIENYGYRLMARIGWPDVKGTFATYSVNGWKAGQTMMITSSKRDFYDQQVYWKSGQSVKQPVQVWIQNVRTKIMGVNQITGKTILLITVDFNNTLVAKV
jgi:hypothetical protein